MYNRNMNKIEKIQNLKFSKKLGAKFPAQIFWNFQILNFFNFVHITIVHRVLKFCVDCSLFGWMVVIWKYTEHMINVYNFLIKRRYLSPQTSFLNRFCGRLRQAINTHQKKKIITMMWSTRSVNLFYPNICLLPLKMDLNSGSHKLIRLTPRNGFGPITDERWQLAKNDQYGLIASFWCAFTWWVEIFDWSLFSWDTAICNLLKCQKHKIWNAIFIKWFTLVFWNDGIITCIVHSIIWILLKATCIRPLSRLKSW